MVRGSLELLFHTFAHAIGVIVIVGMAGAMVGHAVRVIRNRLTPQ